MPTWRLYENHKEMEPKIVGSPVQELDMKYGSGEFYEWVNKIMGVSLLKIGSRGYFETALTLTLMASHP